MASQIRLILASASPRRRQLLKKLRIPFRVIPSHVPENCSQKNPRKFVQELALRKAMKIAQKINKPHTMIIGADTVVVLKGKILGKPKDVRHAERMLGNLSGSRHYVYTGVAIVDALTQKSVIGFESSTVRMKKIPFDQLQRLAEKHLDKAGSYAIQEKKDPIARVVKGSYDNVVGLPVQLVKRLLKHVGAGHRPRPQ